MGVYDVTQKEESLTRFWGQFHGINMGYVEEQYDLYLEDPEIVDPSIREIFDQYGAPIWPDESEEVSVPSRQMTSVEDVKKITSAMKLVDSIRRYGHLEADIYAVGAFERGTDLIKPETYGLTEEDLKNMPASWLSDKHDVKIKSGYDFVNFLKSVYTGTISFEFDHVNNDEERNWLIDQIETGKYKVHLTDTEKKQLLERLVQVESFENFLHKTFVGQKRFSIEGLEMMIPILDQVVKHTTADRIDNILMGMAHRGRLSVLAHVLGKPLDIIFSEFHHSPNKELVPSEGSTGINYGWTGDVKYHFGATKEVKYSDESSTRIILAHNPSHLEFVNPIVAGFTRAVQDDRTKNGFPIQDLHKGFSVLIHGDAAFIGEGIVAETLNLSGLQGYHTGGTIHIIANNLIGYTTPQNEGRSTRYASDLAKGFEIPVIHVNADDPYACISAIKLAYDYRKKFHKDIVIDLVGYRRYGHNEMDEPRATQPLLYQEIDQHPSVATLFFEELNKQGLYTKEELEAFQQKIDDDLKKVYDSLEENPTIEIKSKEMPEALAASIDQFETAVPLDKLKKLNEDLLKRPEGFNSFKRLDRIFKRRQNALDEGHKADWGTGEALAFASILQDGIPIRLTGQDSERGTFAHRHMILHDTKTAEKYCIMHGLSDAKASFAIHNSPLSEAGVLGFEYGYSVRSPETLVIWEAQFGDFANAAQVIFDQFISSARAKWGDKSNMVIMLPHGYEGQGPEHSSARLERFLQMAAENNWIVANVTSSAQLFHILRRQAAMRGREVARPLILMTPKSSLLRNERVASEAKEFTEGKFQTIRDQPNLPINKKKAKRLMLGSGKIMIDIEEAIENSTESFDWLRAIRIEQIYPFPFDELAKEVAELPNLEEIVWVQEEPMNMGSWQFVSEYLRELLKDGQSLRYIGRPKRSSPAVGEPNVHAILQERIVQEAINPAKGGNNNERN